MSTLNGVAGRVPWDGCPGTSGSAQVETPALVVRVVVWRAVRALQCLSRALSSSVRRVGFWSEDGGERPRRSRAWRSRVDEKISCLAVGHSGYAQPLTSVLPALSAAEPGALHVVPCAQPSARPRRESEACHATAPHAPGTKADARPRWHRRRRPRTRRAHFNERPVHVSGLAGFPSLVEVGEQPRRGRVRRSRVDETISGLAVGHCGYAQPPASVVPALRAPPSRTAHTPFYVTLGTSCSEKRVASLSS